jgi:cell division protein FtsW (lipid II flippase)
VFTGRGFVIAAQAPDGFSKLLAGGLTAAIGLQAILIIGGVTRLVPLTGVTLPFMSYGGSSIVTNFVLVAMLLIISHRTRTRGLPPASLRRHRADDAEARELEEAPA